MSWNFFTNTGSLKTSGQIAAGVSTVASASSIAATSGYTILLTGTTGVSTMTGGVTGGVVRLVASGQATGVCVVLNNGTTSNALSLRDSANFGIYAGESIEFVYDGTKWIEINRDVKTVLDYVQITSSVNITGTTSGSPTTGVTGNAITYDGATPIRFEFFSNSVAIGTTNINVGFYEDGSYVSNLGVINTTYYIPWSASHRRTPTAGSHTGSIRAWVNAGTGSIGAGTGSGSNAPAFIRVTRDL